MVILVSGGRTFSNKEQVYRVLDEALSSSPDGHVTIVHGDADGLDKLCKLWAIERGEKHKPFPVAKDKQQAIAIGASFDWETFGKSAGGFRNQHMLDFTHPDKGIVFDGQNGTLDMLTRLFSRGIETRVVGKDA